MCSDATWKANRSPRRPPSNPESTPLVRSRQKFYKFAELQLDRMRIMDVTKVLTAALSAIAFCTMPQTETSEGPQFQLAGQWVAVAQAEKGRGPGPILVDFDSEIDQLCQRLAASGRSGLTIFRYPSS